MGVKAGLHRLAELEAQDGLPQEQIDELRAYLEEKTHWYWTLLKDPENQSKEARGATYRRLRLEVLEVERRAVVNLRDRGVIDDEVMRRVQYDLDVEDVRLQT